MECRPCAYLLDTPLFFFGLVRGNNTSPVAPRLFYRAGLSENLDCMVSLCCFSPPPTSANVLYPPAPRPPPPALSVHRIRHFSYATPWEERARLLLSISGFRQSRCSVFVVEVASHIL